MGRVGCAARPRCAEGTDPAVAFIFPAILMTAILKLSDAELSKSVCQDRKAAVKSFSPDQAYTFGWIGLDDIGSAARTRKVRAASI